jgi:hypothetical protein
MSRFIEDVMNIDILKHWQKCLYFGMEVVSIRMLLIVQFMVMDFYEKDNTPVLRR